MPRILALLRLALHLTLVVVLLALGLQFKAMHRALDQERLRQEQVLKEHQQFVDEHERRMERY
jgi:hypothetical protein